jgi:hypothetical protein
MTPETIFFGSAVLSMLVSVASVVDAALTVRALNRSSRRSDPNARVLARAGIRTASIRTLQMACLLWVSRVAFAINPRPVVSDALECVWWLLALVCWLSSIKELWAMWDRRHIVPPQWDVRA